MKYKTTTEISNNNWSFQNENDIKEITLAKIESMLRKNIIRKAKELSVVKKKAPLVWSRVTHLPIP